MAETKPAEPMNESEYLMIQGQIQFIGAVVSSLNLPGFLDAISRAETVGPILDPTLYMSASDRLAWVKRLARALNAFRNVVLEKPANA